MLSIVNFEIRSLQVLRQVSFSAWLTMSSFAFGQASVGPAGIRPAISDVSTSSMLAEATRADAKLNSLAIVSADRLCSVGDCGTILISHNGGRTWTSVQSNTISNLHGVAFWDTEFGLAVGGAIGGYTRASRSTVLRTSDGGVSWQELPCDLPRLHGVRVAGGRIIAWGDYSTHYKTGVFESTDRGITWHSINMPIGHANALGLSQQGEILAFDSLNRFFYHASPVADRQRDWGPVDVDLDGKVIRSVHHTGASWLICGDRGCLMSSRDNVTWTDVELQLSPEARELCDWKTIAQVGDEIWVAGSPGSIMLTSRDRGLTWGTRPTAIHTPISEVRFLDPRRGWAVGPLGKVFATRDGGQTWYAQRRAGKRAGLLSIAASDDTLPWTPMVAAAWDEQLSVVSLGVASDERIDQAGFLPTRAAQLREIAPRLGINTQVHSLTQVADHDQFAKQLAVAMMTWQPDVVLSSHIRTTDDGTPTRSSQNAISASLLAAMHYAKAPNETQFHAAEELFLSPWSIGKLVEVTEPKSAQFSEQGQRVLRSLGLAIWDVLLPLPRSQRDGNAPTPMRMVWSSTRNKSASASLLGAVPPSSENTRDISTHGIGNYQLVMGRVHRTKSIERLVEYDGAETAWERDLGFILVNLPEQEVVPTLVDLAQRFASPEHFSRRRFVLRRLIDLRPGSDGATWAMLELLTMEASDELVAWGDSDGHSGTPLPIEEANSIRQESRVHDASTVVDASATPWNATPFTNAARQSGVVSASAVESSAMLAPKRLDAEAWFAMFDGFARTAPELISRPDMQMLSYRMSQRLQNGDGLQNGDEAPVRRLEGVLAGQQIVGWPQAAEQEVRFSLNRMEDSRWTAFAARATGRPQLDGQLDEPFWHAVPPMQLSSFQAPSGATEVRWAYDAKYLYMAIVCPRDGKGVVPPIKRIRTYDSILDDQDHVQISLDTDRDYTSTIELAVAEDGRTYDRCCGSRSFNPKWHVCVDSHERFWVAEIAVEIACLTTRVNLVGEGWAVSARRFRPTAEPQSWSRLKSHKRHNEGNGLLLFLPNE